MKKSVIRYNTTPSGNTHILKILQFSGWCDEIRECGARVICVDTIPLFVRIQCNISALPQYLARFAARYDNLNTGISPRGRIFARSTPDKRACRSPSGKCEPIFKRSAFECVRCEYGSPRKAKRTSKRMSFLLGDPYGNRTHVTAVKGPCLNRLTNGPFVVADVGFEPTTCRV